MNPQSLNLEALTKDLVTELGIGEESEEAQVYLLEKLGQNIFVRIGVALKTIVPEEKHAELDAVMEQNDLAAFTEFTKQYIPDFGAFVQAEARKEIEMVKQFMAEELKTKQISHILRLVCAAFFVSKSRKID